MSAMTPKKSSCFVATINLDRTEKLRTDLAQQGFTFSHPPYTVFSAQKKGVSCTLYSSGKLTVQGKDMEEFITFYLEPEILESVTYSYPETEVNLTEHIGIDESGKGDFFGPLCVAGVHADEAKIRELLALGVKDSKKITDSSVHKLSAQIKKICTYSVVFISPKKYNELYANFKNLNQLLAWGHATAIGELVTKTGCSEVIIDQFASEHVVLSALKKKGVKVSLTQRHRAEADPVVAAASIIARSSFLEGLEQLKKQYNLPIPKGASPECIRTGKQLVEAFGPAVLESVGKMHFKTLGEILHDQTSYLE